MIIRLGPLRLNDRQTANAIGETLTRLPGLEGQPLVIRLNPELTAWRGRLLTQDGRGKAVHAGSDIRKRLMVLDTALLSHPPELDRIFIHELHHFVWVRLGNAVRWAFEEICRRQLNARGELGWSAEGAKNALHPDDPRRRTRRWRECVCESFCDTAAWHYSLQPVHEEWTLSPRFRRDRKAWFDGNFGSALSI